MTAEQAGAAFKMPPGFDHPYSGPLDHFLRNTDAQKYVICHGRLDAMNRFARTLPTKSITVPMAREVVDL
ncbi:MAG: hypothetical protein WC890_03170 [Candidatus Margulisiibacteriota bacterium]